jgi:hypothetical protein
VLLAADDPAQISEVQLGQVMAADSSRWLSVVLKGRARLAVVTSGLGVETAASADVWLRGLDFATRVRVAPPDGPLAACAQEKGFPFADSGLPEPAFAVSAPWSSVDSELELRRSLANAGLDVDLAVLDDFSAGMTPPFQIAWFDSQAAGGRSPALRWLEQAAVGELPAIRVAGRDSVPATVIALAGDGVEPIAESNGDPSEFAVTYLGATASTDYAVARADWLLQNPERWLLEAESTSSLFEVSVLAPDAQIAAVSSRYFSALPGGQGAGCDSQVQAARARQSEDAADFACGGADDLSLSLSELGFDEARLSRWFGALTPSAAAFQVVHRAALAPRVTATDFDATGCVVPALPTIPQQSGRGMSPGSAPAQPTVDPGGEPASDSAPQPVVTTDVDLSGSEDSCSGTPNADPPPANDSCSGDSSSSETQADDSCSGDSSSDSTAKDDSCSGNSDSSTGDSSGCGSSSDSGYDGDTCTGNSASSSGNGSERKSSAALEAGSGSPAQRRPRHVRLSLFTLLAAGLSLPLRRRVK